MSKGKLIEERRECHRRRLMCTCAHFAFCNALQWWHSLFFFFLHCNNCHIIQTSYPSNHITKPTHQQVVYKSALPISEDPIRGNYDSSEIYTGSNACESAGIDTLGITSPQTIYKNQTFEELYQHEVANGEGKVAHAEYGDTVSSLSLQYTIVCIWYDMICFIWLIVPLHISTVHCRYWQVYRP